MNNERTRLENISSFYEKEKNNIGIKKIRFCSEIFMKYIKTGSILELGPAKGIMTDILYTSYSENYTVVDGSKSFINNLKNRYPKISAVESIFEDFKPIMKFDNILLGHVLEHVVNPVEILTLCRSWLKDDGIICTAVPNKNSLHRQAAVEMGLLSKLDELTEQDKKFGHRRVFGINSIMEVFAEAEFNEDAIIAKGGYWLKPLSESQIESQWTEQMINAFLKLGELYPDIAGEIYIIATK